MAKKDSRLKKAGKIVANELLGVDDIRRAVKYARKGEFKKAAKSAGAAAVEAGTTVFPISAGAKVGAVAGKATARAVAKESGKKSLQAANKAKGSGKMVYPKPATGKTTTTAPKRDVVVKYAKKDYTQKVALTQQGKKSVPTYINKPSVRMIEKEVTKKQANKATASSNKLRYGSAKAEAQRTRESVASSEILRKGGQNIGATAGATPAVAKPKKDKNKKK